jgi:hypothetical protein
MALRVLLAALLASMVAAQVTLVSWVGQTNDFGEITNWDQSRAPNQETCAVQFGGSVPITSTMSTGIVQVGKSLMFAGDGKLVLADSGTSLVFSDAIAVADSCKSTWVGGLSYAQERDLTCQNNYADGNGARLRVPVSNAHRLQLDPTKAYRFFMSDVPQFTLAAVDVDSSTSITTVSALQSRSAFAGITPSQWAKVALGPSATCVIQGATSCFGFSSCTNLLPASYDYVTTYSRLLQSTAAAQQSVMVNTVTRTFSISFPRVAITNLPDDNSFTAVMADTVNFFNDFNSTLPGLLVSNMPATSVVLSTARQQVGQNQLFLVGQMTAPATLFAEFPGNSAISPTVAGLTDPARTAFTNTFQRQVITAFQQALDMYNQRNSLPPSDMMPTLPTQAASLTSDWLSFAPLVQPDIKLRWLNQYNVNGFKQSFFTPSGVFRVPLPPGWLVTGITFRLDYNSNSYRARRDIGGASIYAQVNYTVNCVPDTLGCALNTSTNAGNMLITGLNTFSSAYMVQQPYFDVFNNAYMWGGNNGLVALANSRCNATVYAGSSVSDARAATETWLQQYVSCGTSAILPDGNCRQTATGIAAQVTSALNTASNPSFSCAGLAPTPSPTPGGDGNRDASSSSSSGGIGIIAGAAGGGGALLLLLLLLLLLRRRGSSRKTANKASDRTVVAFENPMYDDPNKGGAGGPVYDSAAVQDGGLYDEPAFNANKVTKKDNPLYHSNEDLAFAEYDNGYQEANPQTGDAYLDTNQNNGGGEAYLDTAPATGGGGGGYLDITPDK